MTSGGKSNIDCTSVRRKLSAFQDGELAPDVRSAVQEHLKGCAECAARLAEIRELSRITAEMETPAVPADIWPRLQKKLSGIGVGQRGTPGRFSRRRAWIGLVVAALVFVTVSIGATFWFQPAGDGHAHVAVNFGHYLDEFEHNPDAAQQVLLSNYEGRAVSYEEAARKLRYQPVTPELLPSGLTRTGMYLLRMPCCTCVQAVYQRASGEKLAIFEHLDDQPVWFGTRPLIHARCSGMPTSLVQVNDHLAASWKRNGRYVTIIGADDVEQVTELVAYLDGQQSESQPH